MKKYMNLFVVGIIVLWLNQNASTHDKIAVRDALHNLMNEPAANGDIDLSTLPVYRKISNPTVKGYIMAFHEGQLKNLGVNLNNVTVQKLNDWKATHLDNTNHLQWARGGDTAQILLDNGLEPDAP